MKTKKVSRLHTPHINGCTVHRCSLLSLTLPSPSLPMLSCCRKQLSCCGTHTIVILYCDLCRVLLYQHSDILRGEEEGEGLCSLYDNVVLHLPYTPTHTGSARLESQLCRQGNKIKSSCVCVCVNIGGEGRCCISSIYMQPSYSPTAPLTTPPPSSPIAPHLMQCHSVQRCSQRLVSLVNQTAADRLSMVWRQPHSGCRMLAGRTHSPLEERGRRRREKGWINTNKTVDKFMFFLTVIVLNGDGSCAAVAESHSPTGICQDTELHLE